MGSIYIRKKRRQNERGRKRREASALAFDLRESPLAAVVCVVDPKIAITVRKQGRATAESRMPILTDKFYFQTIRINIADCADEYKV